MRAFKQINLKSEKRLVISYATALSLIGCLIIFSPVFAQDQDSTSLVPRTHVEVHRNYDAQGNLEEFDSTWSQTWNSGNLDQATFDSLFSQFNMFGSGFNPWVLNPNDSIPMEPFGFNEDFFGDFDFPTIDSLNPGGFNQPRINGSSHADSLDLHTFQEQYMQMMERMNQFRLKHRKLMEEYFGGSSQSTDEMKFYQQKDPIEKFDKQAISGSKI